MTNKHRRALAKAQTARRKREAQIRVKRKAELERALATLEAEYLAKEIRLKQRFAALVKEDIKADGVRRNNTKTPRKQ